MKSNRIYDIAVIGGGPAGVAAAYAAGCAGADVLLVEASGKLGGSVTGAMHRSICGLYASEPPDVTATLNGGGQRELVARMRHKSPGAVQARRTGKVWVLEFPMAAWESSLGEMCADAGAEVRMAARVLRVRSAAGRIAGLKLDDENWIETGAVIDAAGGMLLQMVGESAMLPPDKDRMLGGYSVRLRGLTGDIELLRLQVPYVLRAAVEKGALPPAARFAVFYPTSVAGEGVCKLAVRPEEFGGGVMEKAAAMVVKYLQDEIEAFALAEAVEQSPRALPRDGRRLRGKFMMREDDILTARKHERGPGGATRAWWPMERWDAAQGPSYEYPPEGDFYDIPDGALGSAAVENLFAAGGSVCATAGAAASIRASGICLATGDAAGRLAASCVGVSDAKAGA